MRQLRKDDGGRGRWSVLAVGYRTAVLVAALGLSGCGAHAKDVAPPAEVAKKQGVLVHESMIPAFNAAVKARRHSEALRLIRQEIASPSMEGDDDYLVQVRTLGIAALKDLVFETAPTPEGEVEAKRYYDEGVRLAGGNIVLRAQLAHVLALFYVQTGRTGLGLSLANEELELWKKQGNAFQTLLAEDTLAVIYGDSGQLALRDGHRRRALEMGKGYFIGPGRPSGAGEWRTYLDILGRALADAAGSGKASELTAVWAVAEPIIERGVGLRSPEYFAASLHFANAGDDQRAADIFAKAKRLAISPDAPDKGESILACPEARFLTAQRKWQEASAAWPRCNAINEKHHFAQDTGDYRLEGIARERAGDLDGALRLFGKYIELIEGTRKSYDVGQRAAFFRSAVRDAYWGRIRILAGKARQSGDEATLLEALRASEAVRARQFGDLLDQRGKRAPELESVAQLRARLGPDDVLLDYVTTQSEIVLFVVTREKANVHLIPIDAIALATELRTLARALASPASSVGAIDGAVRTLSTKLLQPALAAAANKRHFIVLPDAELNAIPFDLLVRSGKPLVDDTIVTLVPSLTHFVGGKRALSSAVRGAFAVADPQYPTTLRVGDARLDTRDAPARTGRAGAPLFVALPETRREVESIGRTMAGDPVDVLLGEKASASAVKRADLKKYRYLHFATHGVLGNQVPGLSEPALVLAEGGGEDAFLSASEVERLELGAELTVLSACNTGTGDYVTGEGVLGMSRAFLIAGSRSVIMSLWSVDSAATEQLMSAFYKSLRAGLEPGEALKTAKLSVRGSRITTAGDDRGLELEVRAPKREMASASHPYFWSAFVLVGR